MVTYMFVYRVPIPGSILALLDLVLVAQLERVSSRQRLELESRRDVGPLSQSFPFAALARPVHHRMSS